MRFRTLLALLRDSSLVLLGRYGQYIVALVSIPVVARVLGIEGFGQYAIANAGAFFGSLLVDLGLTSVLASDLARGNLRAPSLTTFILLRFAVLAALCAALAGVLLADAAVPSLVIAGMVMGGTSSIGQEWILIGSSRYVVLATSQVCVRVASLVGLIILLPKQPSVWVAIAILTAANLAGAAITWTVTRRAVAIAWPQKSEAAHLLRVALPIVSSRALGLASSQGPVLGFSLLVPAKTFGFFAATDKLVRAAQSSMDALSIALLPRLGRAAGQSRDAFGSRVRRALTLTFGLGAIGATVLTLLAPWIVPIVLGRQFAAAIPALQIQAWSLPAAGLTSVCMGAVLISARDYRGMLLVGAIGLAALPIGLAVGAASGSPMALSTGALIVDWASAGAAVTRTWLRHGLRGDRRAPEPLLSSIPFLRRRS